MRVVMLGLALAVLVARPAGAGRMLYATAASDDRIDGFCLRRDGTIEGKPRLSVNTNGTQPRRLIVANLDNASDPVDDVLFVVEADRVEAFQIGTNGGLKFIGRTRPRERSGPRDAAISLSTTTQMLYVPDRSRSRILGYALPLLTNEQDPGPPEQDFKTCIETRTGAGLQNLLIPDDRPNRLYVSSSGGNGRIEVFGIDADGNLFGGEDEDGKRIFADCSTSDAVTTTTSTTTSTAVPAASTTTTAVFTTTTTTVRGTPPLSQRRRIFDVKTFAVSGNLLYAEDRGRKRIRAFQLKDDGSFVAPGDADCEPTKNDKFCKQKSKTNRIANYQHILLFHTQQTTTTVVSTESTTTTLVPAGGTTTTTVSSGNTTTTLSAAILSTQFFRGRIDSYALDPVNGLLPKRARVSHADLRLTPVRLAAANNLSGKGATVYVAAGEFDRIIAYRLRQNGTLQGKGAKPFSQTDKQDGSFPNDVAIAMLAEGSCSD